MKSIYSALLLLSLFLTACHSSEPVQTIDPAKRLKIALRSFTDTTTKDTFKVILKGEKPAEMALLFTITPPGQHTPIYTKMLNAKELLNNYKESLDLGKEKKKVQFMEDELNLFFEDENFIEPAVTPTEQSDKNTPDKNFFEELKTSGLNGFKYRTGKESKVYIAWSARDKKVKPYYECCR